MLAAGRSRYLHRRRRCGSSASAPVSPRHLLVLLSFLLVACTGGEESSPPASRQSPIVPLDTGTVFIETESDTFVVSVEIAETSSQREIGLMERVELPEDEGMIFLSYEENDSTRGFYMFRTRIPLDIAYLDLDGRIVAIRSMEPCTNPYAAYCPEYPPGAPYWGALEMNRGYFQQRGIDAGDLVTLRRSDRQSGAAAESG